MQIVSVYYYITTPPLVKQIYIVKARGFISPDSVSRMHASPVAGGKRKPASKNGKNSAQSQHFFLHDSAPCLIFYGKSIARFFPPVNDSPYRFPKTDKKLLRGTRKSFADRRYFSSFLLMRLTSSLL